MRIGILAIQGDFGLHQIALDKLSVNSLLVKHESDLEKIDALIFPGGESTTISLLLNKYNLIEPIVDFADKHCIFGTCAGAILMSLDSNDSRIKNFGFIDVLSHRNAWGSQIDSFSDYITFSDSQFLNEKYYATFIRGPKFTDISTSCNVLGYYGNEPVLIRNDRHLICSFHPEINRDLCIYKYFFKMINE